MSIARTIVEAASPVSYVETSPITYTQRPVTVVEAAPVQYIQSVEAAPIALTQQQQVVVADNRWGDYSPEEIQLAEPVLPEADYRCYQPPQVPAGQTRYLQVTEPTGLKQLQQNFNDVRTAIRENNTHVQRNKTNVTNINRNHNHLLRIVTNENNYNHYLTNNVVRVADIHRQRIENLKGETRNFKDFKATQKVEAVGCRRDGIVQVAAVPAQAQQIVQVQQAAPAITVAAQRIATPVNQIQVLSPATATPVRYLESVALSGAQTLRSRSVILQ
jgi:hypothetical protein